MFDSAKSFGLANDINNATGNPKCKRQFDHFHTFHPKHTTKGRPRFIRHSVPLFPGGIEVQPKRTEVREEPQCTTYRRPHMREP
jgi:hypothetical protein